MREGTPAKKWPIFPGVTCAHMSQETALPGRRLSTVLPHLYCSLSLPTSGPIKKYQRVLSEHSPLRRNPCNSIIIRHSCRPAMQQRALRIVPLRPCQHARGLRGRVQSASTCTNMAPHLALLG